MRPLCLGTGDGGPRAFDRDRRGLERREHGRAVDLGIASSRACVCTSSSLRSTRAVPSRSRSSIPAIPVSSSSIAGSSATAALIRSTRSTSASCCSAACSLCSVFARSSTVSFSMRWRTASDPANAFLAAFSTATASFSPAAAASQDALPP